MHPYRELATPEVADDPELRRDDRILASVVLAIGGLRVALAVVLGEVFDAEVTVAAAMAGIGIALLAATFVEHRS